jgi:hypothetical protein
MGHYGYIRACTHINCDERFCGLTNATVPAQSGSFRTHGKFRENGNFGDWPMIHASGWGGGSDPLWQRTNQSEQLAEHDEPALALDG